MLTVTAMILSYPSISRAPFVFAARLRLVWKDGPIVIRPFPSLSSALHCGSPAHHHHVLLPPSLPNPLIAPTWLAFSVIGISVVMQPTL